MPPLLTLIPGTLSPHNNMPVSWINAVRPEVCSDTSAAIDYAIVLERICNCGSIFGQTKCVVKNLFAIVRLLDACLLVNRELGLAFIALALGKCNVFLCFRHSAGNLSITATRNTNSLGLGVDHLVDPLFANGGSTK